MNKIAETGAIVKNWGGKTSVALVYPNTYYIGMSNLAIHSLYRELNRDERLVAERFFLPGYSSVKSVESGRELSDFSVAMFTFSFEGDYLNIPRLLGKGISLGRNEREKHAPLLIAGGPSVTMNPEALSKIFDAIFVGEVEAVYAEFIEIIKSGYGREEMLGALSKLDGFYVPDRNDIRDVKKATPNNLDKYPVRSSIWTSDTEFGHMHLVETMRGCSWWCRFCATPGIYQPLRFVSGKAIISSSMEGAAHRKHIGLVGSDVLGHPDLIDFSEKLIAKKLKLSFSSVRVNRISPEIASLLVSSGHKRITLGIEAGSERLRKVIEKRLTDCAIFEAVKNIANAGISNLKLYFMIGLPGEEESDIREIASLASEIRKIILSERKKKTDSPDINIVVTPFVPKKLTKLADAQFAGAEHLKEALKILKREIGKMPSVSMTGESPKEAELEYVLSSGGSELFGVIKNGGVKP